MVSSNEINTLRQRWSDASTAIALAYLNGKSRTELSLTPQGLVDLRGVVIEDFIKDKQFQDVDLSACILNGFGQFGFCRFENCNFSHAALGTNIGRQFIRCNFQKANLQDAVLRGEFHDCNYDGAHLVAASGNQIKFCRCTFRQTNFKRAILLNCVFEDCVMESCVFGGGSLGNARFESTNVDEIDFSDTILDGTSYQPTLAHSVGSTATTSQLFYKSGEQVELGDRVAVYGWFGIKFRGSVSYIPGISPRHRQLDSDGIQQWAITAEDGTVYVMIYDPERSQPSRRYRFLGRGTGPRVAPTDKLG